MPTEHPGGMATGRKQIKKKLLEEKSKKDVYDFTEEDVKKDLSGSDDEARENGTPIVEKLAKKRSAADFEQEEASSDISKVLQVKRKRLECLTKNYMKGGQHKLEQLWNTHHGQRQKITQQYSEQVSAALQQWETEAVRAEEQEEKLNNLFRQHQKILQQARDTQKQKLKTVKELYEQLVKNMEEMEKSQEAFLQGAQQELKKEMATLQKKILMDTQQQEMATVRKSLHSMLF
uniref:Synaptonemal complex protein 3 n=1 Tax=Acanthochromis polyacanthus TaxID=80966 RepID=A0A3Q1FT54_9TELE